MYKINQIIFSAFFILLFCSCKGQLNTNDLCKKKFKEARDLAYANSTRQSALDSALSLTDECMQCDSIRKAVVDFKITLLISMKKYAEGISFIDSLKGNDFTFEYKKNLLSKNLKALDYGSKNDTIKQNLMYKEIANDIEQYSKKQNISNAEFKEIYTDLFAVKENYLDANQINKEVEDLKKLYPEKEAFFDFFKK
jgi:hypothetical protein